MNTTAVKLGQQHALFEEFAKRFCAERETQVAVCSIPDAGVLFEPLQRFDFVGIQKTESPLTRGACWLRVRTFLEGHPIESFALHFGSSIEFESLTQFNVVRRSPILGSEAEGFFKQKEILDPNYFDGLGNLFVFLATRSEESLQWIGQKVFEIESERLSDRCFRDNGPQSNKGL